MEMENYFGVSGKKVLVTGSARGIGLAISEIFAKNGASIAMNDITVNELEKSKDAIANKYGVEVIALPYDISNLVEIDKMFKKLDKEFGSIDILVNNAGVETISSCLEVTENQWDNIVNTNLKGAFFCAQKAAERMKEKGGGTIINISSVHDTITRKGLSPYCISKAGVSMLTKCFSLELSADNIRTVTVSPGAIETEMNRKEIEKVGRDKFEAWIPQGRLGTVSDVANTVLFAASNMGAYANGTAIYIDGSFMNDVVKYDPTNLT